MRFIRGFPFFILLVFVFSLTSNAADKEVSLKVSANKSIVTVGTKISYTIKIRYEDPILLVGDLPALSVIASPSPEPVNVDFEITEKKKKGIVKGKVHFIQKTFQIIPYSIGEFQVQPFEIKFKDNPESATTRVIQSDPILIQVKSVLKEGEKKDIRGIKGIIDLQETIRTIFIRAMKIIGLLILLYIFFRLFQFLLGRIFSHKKSFLSPYELAVKNLNELEESDLIANQEIKKYGDKLSDILRAFLGAFYHFDAMDLTTKELQGKLASAKMDEKLKERSLLLLTECDLVKFAKLLPEPERLGALLHEAKMIINLLHRQALKEEEEAAKRAKEEKKK